MDNNFYDRLKKALSETLSQAVDEFTAQKLCGFALYTDESAMSLSVSINTEEALFANWKETPEYKEDFRWSPPEWSVEGYHPEAFDEINKDLLAASSDEQTKKNFPEDRNAFFEKCVEALHELRTEIPGDVSKEFVLMFAISDFADAEKEIEWTEKINDPEKTQLFRDWRSSF